ncbi:uncharacterized protein LOC144103387 [Amblyomma americanum]
MDSSEEPNAPSAPSSRKRSTTRRQSGQANITRGSVWSLVAYGSNENEEAMRASPGETSGASPPSDASTKPASNMPINTLPHRAPIGSRPPLVLSQARYPGAAMGQPGLQAPAALTLARYPIARGGGGKLPAQPQLRPASSTGSPGSSRRTSAAKYAQPADVPFAHPAATMATRPMYGQVASGAVAPVPRAAAMAAPGGISYRPLLPATNPLLLMPPPPGGSMPVPIAVGRKIMKPGTQVAGAPLEAPEGAYAAATGQTLALPPTKLDETREGSGAAAPARSNWWNTLASQAAKIVTFTNRESDEEAPSQAMQQRSRRASLAAPIQGRRASVALAAQLRSRRASLAAANAQGNRSPDQSDEPRARALTSPAVTAHSGAAVAGAAPTRPHIQDEVQYESSAVRLAADYDSQVSLRFGIHEREP